MSSKWLNLQTFLGDMDWSPDDFAALTGIHRTTVFRWLAGSIPVPGYIALICRLCRGISKSKLLVIEQQIAERAGSASESFRIAARSRNVNM